MFKLGARVRVGPIFVRGNFITTAETILEQIPLQSGGELTTTAAERGQRNLGFLQLFNNASPISFPGREEKREVVPMVVEVEERYEQYSVLHVGAGVSTEQKPPNSALPFGVYLRGGYENRNCWGHGWQRPQPHLRHVAAARDLSFLDRRFLGTLFRFDVAVNYLQQATVRLGDIRSGGGSIGFSREMYPGVDAGIHYNLRNTTHTEPLIRLAGPDETISSVRLGTTVGSLSANIEWLRMDNRLVPTRGFRINAPAELALPVLSVPLRPFPLDVGDDTFLKISIRSLSVIPIGRFLSLRHGFRFEQGFPLGGASLLPKVERYFAGGDTTIRGYQLDRARVEIVSYPRSVAGRNDQPHRLPAAGRQPAHPAERRPLVPDQPALVRLGVHRQRRGRRLARRPVGPRVPPRGRDLAAADPVADRRRQPGVGVAARSGPRRHQDRRLPRQRRLAVLGDTPAATSSREGGRCGGG